MIFEPKAECQDPGERRALQSARLRALVARLADRVPFYAEKLRAAHVLPGDIRGVEDLPRLPITRKTDLRDTYPFGLLAVPRRECVRIHASSGTTGRPTVVAYSAADLELFSTVVARALAMAGAEPGMLLHNAYGYGLFTGGLGLHYGGEKLGMTVVPVSGGMTERQVLLIEDLKPDVLCCTPSYALTLASEFAKRRVRPEDLSLRFALHGAEPWTDGMRAQIDRGLGVRCTNIYGLSEIIGPGVSNECVEARNGSHVMEDHFYPEILDPATMQPVEDGQEGVLVLTTLTKEALPLLRYWTGDITSLTRGPCACGRTLVRMALIKGRTDDMLIIRGVNVYPSQVESVLARCEELAPHYRLVVTREHNLDALEVEAELDAAFAREIVRETLSDEIVEADTQLQALRGRVAHLLHDTIGVSMKVTLLPPGAAPRSEGGKLNRVADQRPRP
ncbi:MAG: phenylacetate--CoA ligase [Gemmatimonadetes bacterium]|nr:phenylacetate--CoA ligase [Gemmatimonadota bacterium]